MKTAEFGKPCSAVAAPGKCRICGCTMLQACVGVVPFGDHGFKRNCGWADDTETLCDAPACLKAVRSELTVDPEGWRNLSGLKTRGGWTNL